MASHERTLTIQNTNIIQSDGRASFSILRKFAFF